jgi:hypothetical protein
MTGCKGILAGDLSLTILFRRLCSVFRVPSLDIPKTKGIGQLLSVDLIALPKLKDAEESYEKRELESPSSLSCLLVDLGESDRWRREGSPG